MAATQERTKITPAQLSREWGVSVARVKSWISSGELVAMIASVDARSKRPRLLIDRRDIEQFEKTRQLPAAAARTRQVRRRRLAGIERHV